MFILDVFMVRFGGFIVYLFCLGGSLLFCVIIILFLWDVKMINFLKL